MPPKLEPGLQNALAVYYGLLALMNLGFAAYYYYGPKRRDAAALWAAVGGLFLLHTVVYAAHLGWVVPHRLRESVDWLMGPVTYTMLSAVGFVLVLYFRRFFVQPQVAFAVLNLSLLAAGWALTDPEFQKIVGKPDNVPISMLIFSVGFFTWLGLYRAVRNDERIKRGEPVLENCRILCMECHKNTPSYGTGQQAGTVTTAQVSPEAKGP